MMEPVFVTAEEDLGDLWAEEWKQLPPGGVAQEGPQKEKAEWGEPLGKRRWRILGLIGPRIGPTAIGNDPSFKGDPRKNPDREHDSQRYQYTL